MDRGIMAQASNGGLLIPLLKNPLCCLRFSCPSQLQVHVYAPPSRLAYSSSILSSYSLSASFSSSVFSVCAADATLCVDLSSTSCAVCAVAEEVVAEVDFVVVEGTGTGILTDVLDVCFMFQR